jgi:hypothetical protein
MPASFLQGFMGTQQATVEARNDITVFIRNWFANRNPLATRLPYVPVDTVTWVSYNHKYRNRSVTSSGSFTTGTTLTVSDNSNFLNHDLIMVTDSAGSGTEIMQIGADPLASNQLTVVRGVYTTAPYSLLTNVTSGSTVTLLSNSRTGAEINQTGLTTVGLPRTAYAQTYQMPVQIGGSAQTARAQVMPAGIQSPFDFNQTIQLQNLVDDIENTIYYGVGQAPLDAANNGGTAQTAKMAGIRSILTTNNISFQTSTTPSNAAAYSSTDLIRDTLQACRTGGGEPDLLVVSTNFMSAFAIWGQAVQRIPAGETAFGTPISVLEAPFLHGVTIIEAPLLSPYTAIALTSSEVYLRNKRNPFWNLRGNRGDMIEGEWIAELGLEVINESHHAFVEGITAFSAN